MILTDTQDVLVCKRIVVLQETVGGKRHDQDAKTQIRNTKTVVRRQGEFDTAAGHGGVDEDGIANSTQSQSDGKKRAPK